MCLFFKKYTKKLEGAIGKRGWMANGGKMEYDFEKPENASSTFFEFCSDFSKTLW